MRISKISKTQFLKLKKQFDITDEIDAFDKEIVFSIKNGFASILMIEGLKRKCAHLTYLYIDKAHRNNGIGKQLYKELIEHFRDEGVETLSFYIAYTNIESLSLAIRIGAKIEGFIMYPNGTPGYELVISINQ